MNVQISCATDWELSRMLFRDGYTQYYKSLILEEIKRRSHGNSNT